MKILKIFALLLGLAFVPFGVATVNLLHADEGALVDLSITGLDGKVHPFKVELADTGQEREVGLMYREKLAPDHGMIFDFKTSRRVSMWMKNTLIPLDMLFIGADGKVRNIAARTVPGSLESINSDGKVRYVLEVPGGTAERLGIAPGSAVHYEGMDR